MGRLPVIAIIGNSIFHGVFNPAFEAVIPGCEKLSVPLSLSGQGLPQLDSPRRVASHPPRMLIKTTMPKPIRYAEDSMAVAAFH